MTAPLPSRPGLVLTGGGARGAYQAGVLRAVAEITRPSRQPGSSPFHFLSGTSAGAINVSFLAARHDDFDQATNELWDMWATLETDDVVDTRSAQLTLLGLRWVKDLSMGGLMGEPKSNYLLNTWPLRKLIEKHVSKEALVQAISSGHLGGVAFTATHYATGTTVIFHAGAGDDWQRTTRISRRAELSATHVLASAAIPIFFPPVLLGGSMYGDGGIRDAAPMSPVIHMGASRVFAVGIRYHRTPDQVRDMNLSMTLKDVKLADIAGVMLNSVFLDGLEADVERLQRINRTVRTLAERGPMPADFPLREVPSLVMQPSRDLGTMAADHFRTFPFVLRRLLRGVGASDARGSDLLSYLSFDGAYTRPLLELGYTDGHSRAAEILEFLRQ